VRNTIPLTRFFEISRGFFEEIFADLGSSRRETLESGVGEVDPRMAKFGPLGQEKKVLESS
jgi:hypothetical protein